MIRILLADDQRLFREALALLLSVQDGVQVVGEAADGAQAVRLAATTAPDVVLMDLRMPVMDGPTATRHLLAARPGVRVIALTTFDDDADVFAAIQAGAIGYLLKDASSQRLMEAVHAAVRGESVLEPGVAAKLVSRVARMPAPAPAPLITPLSGRELEVAGYWPAAAATGRSLPRCSWPRAPSRTM